MLLKVSDGIGGWNILDKVDRAYLLSKRFTIKDPKELEQQDGVVINLIATDCFRQGKEVPVGILEFERSGNKRRAYFTDIAYVCNDDGDTLDKLRANHNDRKR